ncbi:recombinase family protein [Microlunatus sp. Y2014]|uniref:recombinase family protein n=1 Tax=Microlunatus sp. Y2014 TaxID=3418488 RepID=UPI003DA76396
MSVLPVVSPARWSRCDAASDADVRGDAGIGLGADPIDRVCRMVIPMRRAAIYTRISKDPTSEKAGVRRQEAECRAKADELGARVVRVFSDNDTSAFSGKPRPGYDALLAAIVAREIDAVVVWHTDRLYRRMADLERYIAVCGEKPGTPTYAVSVGEGHIDLTTPAGRMVARQMGVAAQYEVEQKGERQRSSNRAKALEGKVFKGGRRCFGYEPDGVTIRESEAETIRWAFDHFLSGGSLGHVARVWNESGLYPPQGKRNLPADLQQKWEREVEEAEKNKKPRPKRPYVPNPWESITVARTMKTARLAGIKTYQRQIVHAEDGSELRGEWPAVVDYDVWKRAMAIFEGRKRTQAYPSPLLLSGVGLCDECGARLQSGGQRNGKARYRCKAVGSHVYREAEPVNDYVVSLILDRLADEDVADLLVEPTPGADPDDLQKQLRELTARQTQFGLSFAEGTVTLDQVTAANKAFETQRADLERQLADAMPSNGETLVALVTADDARTVWNGLPTDLQRDVVDTLAEVRLKPTRTGHRTYVMVGDRRMVNPDTVVVEWRGATG